MIEELKLAWKTAKIWIQGVGIVGVFLLGSWAGCSAGHKQNASTIEEQGKTIAVQKAQLVANANAIEEANKQVKANQQFAREREQLANDIAKDVSKKNKKIAQLEEQISKKIVAAEKKNPDCKAVMEMNICPELMDY